MRKILILFLIFIGMQTVAQEKLMPVMPLEKDSARIELERQILYQQLLSGTMQGTGLAPNLELPKFDLGNAISRLKYNLNSKEFFNPGNLMTFDINSIGFVPSPFFRNGTVFSGASYNLNDKFKMGGYSFGANSIFSAPLPNQSMNNFDTRGAAMFMQYKVSKNFKIETRVSVTQGNGPGF